MVGGGCSVFFASFFKDTVIFRAIIDGPAGWDSFQQASRRRRCWLVKRGKEKKILKAPTHKLHRPGCTTAAMDLAKELFCEFDLTGIATLIQ